MRSFAIFSLVALAACGGETLHSQFEDGSDNNDTGDTGSEDTGDTDSEDTGTTWPPPECDFVVLNDMAEEYHVSGRPYFGPDPGLAGDNNGTFGTGNVVVFSFNMRIATLEDGTACDSVYLDAVRFYLRYTDLEGTEWQKRLFDFPSRVAVTVYDPLNNTFTEVGGGGNYYFDYGMSGDVGTYGFWAAGDAMKSYQSGVIYTFYMVVYTEDATPDDTLQVSFQGFVNWHPSTQPNWSATPQPNAGYFPDALPLDGNILVCN